MRVMKTIHRHLLFLLALLCPLPATASTTELIPVLEALVNLRARATTGTPAPVTRIATGGLLKQGHRGTRVAQLNSRLAELGYAVARGGELFDAQTDAAVRAFQQTADLDVDGMVDEHTRFNLNLSDKERIAILRRQFDDMERLFAQHGDGRFVVINIPAFSLRAFENGRRVVDSRVIVGKPTRQTPPLSNAMTGIIFNPAWSPPSTILARDIFHDGEVDIKTVERLGLKLIDGQGQAASLDRVATPADLAAGAYRFVQAPGDKNALGLLKFDLDNGLGIYLHDTNHRELFKRSSRALSSGCIRVERFRELAAWAMHVTPDDIDVALRDRRTRRLAIEKLPVHFVYWPAEAVGEKIVFQRDIYDHAVRQQDSGGKRPGALDTQSKAGIVQPGSTD